MPTDAATTRADAATSDQSPERLQQAATGIVDKAGRTAERQASVSMSRAGDTLESVARAVRQSGTQLRSERPEFADVAELAARRVEDASTYLRTHDAREVLDEAERIARRQPALVIGGGLLMGLVVGRLLRSGAEPASSGRMAARAGGAGAYRSAAWTGGTATPTASSRVSTSRPAGTTTVGSGYGTGYGASYDTDFDTAGTGVPSSAARNPAATDDAASGTPRTRRASSAGGSNGSRRTTTGSSSTSTSTSGTRSRTRSGGEG